LGIDVDATGPCTEPTAQTGFDDVTKELVI
jgi:hypothetical protein